jgi:outer membrane lipoprotein-sorting protein
MTSRVKVLLVAILALYGCAGVRPVTPPVAGRPAHGLKAEAVVEMKKTLTLRGKARISAESPGSFRIEVLGPFNATMALIISDGRSLYVFSGTDEKEYLWDDPSFPYSFRAEDVVSSLLGSPSPNPGTIEKSDYSVSSGNDGDLTLTRMKDGKIVLTVAMADFRVVAGARLPFDIRIEDRRGTLRIRYSSVEVDPAFSPDAFAINPLLPR